MSDETVRLLAIIDWYEEKHKQRRAQIYEAMKERDYWNGVAKGLGVACLEARRDLRASRAEATKAERREAVLVAAGAWAKARDAGEDPIDAYAAVMDALHARDDAAIRAPQPPESVCVCTHLKSEHVMRGGVMACTIKDCACGPGCIHEGFVDRDPPSSPQPPEPEKACEIGGFHLCREVNRIASGHHVCARDDAPSSPPPPCSICGLSMVPMANTPDTFECVRRDDHYFRDEPPPPPPSEEPPRHRAWCRESWGGTQKCECAVPSPAPTSEEPR